MSRFFMTIGIPASGKTMLAECLSKSGVLHLSSDALREELFGDEDCQDKNSELFEEMNRRTIISLKNGQDVIYDATNINSKRRKALLSQLPKDTYKICFYMPSTPQESERGQKYRDRKVPREVLKKMYMGLQIPMKHEGWDEIAFSKGQGQAFEFPETHDEFCRMLYKFYEGECVNMPQDNPYHTLSVSKHMFYAYNIVKKTGNERLMIATLLHDIGKPYCKVENGKYCSFKCHENVSAQKAFEILIQTNLSKEDIIYICTLIELHMRLNNLDVGSKQWDKLRNELGEEMFSDLLALNNADKNAR